MNFLLVFLSFLTIISFTSTKAQDRAPHGLVYENPMAFSPSAYNFFHPKSNPPNIQGSCVESSCAPLPIAATVQSSLAEESKARNEKSESRVGAGGIVGVIFGFIMVVLLAMGVYYVVTNRRGGSRGESTILPSV
ncbi:hypothetical protein L1987_00544 [Smallanthus sonchifolius]|uniref:Uncharacterized protein n=1 Tax=Smallanthus sonchifolius TaxID=185202 RepID=A0ACB9K2N4_9ASTR|nr:hypothetical protein L1987_00544 [Smallanthus sonchifolius]